MAIGNGANRCINIDDLFDSSLKWEVIIMSDTTKFKVVQNKDTKKVQLELWHRYGDAQEDWMNYETFDDLSVSELKELKEYLVKIFSRVPDK